MRISAIEEYGLRCALQLARAFGAGQSLPASHIAELEGMSVEYVSKVLYRLRKAHLVAADRGIHGGFRLARPPEDITVLELSVAVNAMGKKSVRRFCEIHAGQMDRCVHQSECSVRPVWVVLQSYFDQLLSCLTLKDLFARESKIESKIEKMAVFELGRLRQRFLQLKKKKKQEMIPAKTVAASHEV